MIWLLVFCQLDVPASVRGEPGEFIPIVAKGVKSAGFVAVDRGLSVLPSALLKDPNTTIVQATTKGKYRLLVYSVVNDAPTHKFVEVQVGDGNTPEPTPPPDEPKPNPEPVKPKKPDGFAGQVFDRIPNERDAAVRFANTFKAVAALMPAKVGDIDKASIKSLDEAMAEVVKRNKGVQLSKAVWEPFIRWLNESLSELGDEPTALPAIRQRMLDVVRGIEARFTASRDARGDE